VVRRVIRAAQLGQDGGDLSSPVNPEVVEETRQVTGSRQVGGTFH
jgi:hypothetical protein